MNPIWLAVVLARHTRAIPRAMAVPHRYLAVSNPFNRPHRRSHSVRTKRIHIVSCGPRTGTTLLAEAMRVCFDIDAHEEHEARMFREPPPGARVYLTKHPGEILKVGPRLRVDPDFHVIYLLRDPRDTITSKHGKDPDRYWAGLRYWKAFAPMGRTLWDHPRFTAIRYEDFAREPDRTQQVLLRAHPFLNVVAPFSRYHEVVEPSGDSLKALRSVRPITPGSIGSWRDHLPRVAGQLKIHGSISDDLIKYAYEKDDSWEAVLEGVAPDLSPSHFSEHFTTDELKFRRKGRYRQAVKALIRRS